MENLVTFINAFTVELITYLIFLVLIVVAAILGIKFRKSKNKKDEIAQSAANIEAASVAKN